MNIAISSLAWTPDTEETTFSVLKKCGISNVEIVFSKIKPWDVLVEKDIIDYRSKLDNYNLCAISTQSLFYGTNIDISDTDRVLNHFEKVINYCNILGIKILVFGSPSMRKGTPDVTNNLFYQLDKILKTNNVQLAIEPNAKIYGGNYWHTVADIKNTLVKNQYTNISSMIDLHNLELENIDPVQEFLINKDIIKHLHISEVGLKPINNNLKHQQFSNVLKSLNYGGIITYEVLSTDNKDILFDSIRYFSQTYG